MGIAICSGVVTFFALVYNAITAIGFTAVFAAGVGYAVAVVRGVVAFFLGIDDAVSTMGQ